MEHQPESANTPNKPFSMFWGTLYSFMQIIKDDVVSSSSYQTTEGGKFKVYPTSGRFITGPLLGCKAPVLCDVGLADANSDKSLRWPSRMTLN
jgi:hypothetical protein